MQSYMKRKIRFLLSTELLLFLYLDKDSMYVAGDKILLTGKTEKRIVRIFKNVKIFKSDLQGKCDSIHTSQNTGLTRMFNNPILWSGKSQITGDSIQFITDKGNK